MADSTLSTKSGEGFPTRTGRSISIEEWRALDLVGPVIGIDEAGRGAWAGPLVVGGAAFGSDTPAEVVASMRDSKTLTPRRRNALVKDVMWWCPSAVCSPSAEYIDVRGLAWAASWAAFQVIRKLQGYYNGAPITVVLDGQESNWSQLSSLLKDVRALAYYFVVRADQCVKEVSAASILAKVVHDEIMRGFDRLWPQFGFSQHQGYGTPAHMAALDEYGLSPIHRRSYHIGRKK